MSVKPETIAILRQTQETLAMARGGLSQLLARLPLYERLMGFKNLVVWGRAVTNVLQKLRGVEPSFDGWYRPHRQEMEADPLMKRLYKMRSEILKEGALEIDTFMVLEQWGASAKDFFGPPPANAVDLIASEALGGAAWVIRMPDGTTEYYFVPLPSELGVASAVLPDTPQTHLGRSLKDETIESVGRHYYAYLEDLVQDAKRMFLGPHRDLH